MFFCCGQFVKLPGWLEFLAFYMVATMFVFTVLLEVFCWLWQWRLRRALSFLTVAVSLSFIDPHLLLFRFVPVWCCYCGSGFGVQILRMGGCLSACLLLFFRREWWVGEDPEVWCGFGVAVVSFVL
ncbi:hypothetical protein TSUD_292640 [Trifolium subterraneum]|uniref:Uncharacterized protein n=1 Tax=Trifolium subterraneum TaxID=3900 RepID=A0A2Z6P8E9_TRISU|nr:hypothetical protein TSUD_292640 [Trifolium subterraneum]